MDKLLLSPEEAMEVTGIGRTALYQMLRANEIPHIKRGRRYFISVKHLNLWIENRCNVKEVNDV